MRAGLIQIGVDAVCPTYDTGVAPYDIWSGLISVIPAAPIICAFNDILRTPIEHIEG